MVKVKIVSMILYFNLSNTAIQCVYISKGDEDTLHRVYVEDERYCTPDTLKIANALNSMVGGYSNTVRPSFVYTEDEESLCEYEVCFFYKKRKNFMFEEDISEEETIELWKMNDVVVEYIDMEA